MLSKCSIAALSLLILQNFLLTYLVKECLPYTEKSYDHTVMVLITESAKILVSATISICTHNKISSSLDYRLAIPAALYTVQNNFNYMALARLTPLTFQVTLQLKILFTALFSFLMLGRRLMLGHWFALIVLCAGVVMVQIYSGSISKLHITDCHSSSLIFGWSRFYIEGLLMTISNGILSGFSSIYFEKLLKRPSNANKSLWVQSMQLSVFGFMFSGLWSFLTFYNSDGNQGFFSISLVEALGNPIVLAIMGTNVFGGFLVMMVVKWADSIIKGFATSLSIVLIALYYHSGERRNVFLCIGILLVVSSMLLYALTSNVPLGIQENNRSKALKNKSKGTTKKIKRS